MKHTDIKDMPKKASVCPYINCNISWCLVSYHTKFFSSRPQTPENTEEDPNYPEPAQEGDIPMEYSSD
jgi:hypothetical protein